MVLSLVVEDNRELRRYLVNGLSALFDMLETENGLKSAGYSERQGCRFDYNRCHDAYNGWR